MGDYCHHRVIPRVNLLKNSRGWWISFYLGKKMSGKVCTAPEMIPAPRQIDPEMIPIMPHFLSRRPRNDPQLILGME